MHGMYAGATREVAKRELVAIVAEQHVLDA
jgi:hypothetical protein